MTDVRYYASLGLVLVCTLGSAQAMDAGAELRRFQDETQRRLQEPKKGSRALPDESASPSRAAAKSSDHLVFVSGYQVHGVSLLSESQVATVLKEFTGRTLTTADIHEAANALMRYYRERGYFLAKVFVPPQSFTDIVRLDVEEGRLETGGIEVRNQGIRVDTPVVKALLDKNLYSDQPLRRQDFERAVLLADDLPGTRIGTLIYPGTDVGTARLRAVMADEPLISGNIDLDNFNSRTLGQGRIGATVYLNSPAGVGDQWVTRLVTSGSRSNYAYLTYLRPVGISGLRIGASIDQFRYDAPALDRQSDVGGLARDTRVYFTYPIIRSRHSNLNLRADVSHYAVADRNPNNPAFVAPSVNPFAESRRRLNLVAVSLSGDDNHEILPNGTSLFDLSFTAGRLDVVGDANHQSYDSTGAPLFATGPKTDGDFARINLNLQRLQHLSGEWSAYGSLRGQWASRNLDASQRMHLGGATSLSGYPSGEASGDHGTELHLELRRDFAPPWGGNLQAGIFYSQGWLQRFKSPWFSVDNHVSLRSTGLQLTQTIDGHWVIRGVVGWQLGQGSPTEQANGYNSDDRVINYRIWVQAIRYFGSGGGR